MRSLKYRVFLCLEVLRILVGHALVSLDKVAHWIDYVVLDVLDQGIDEWSSNVLDPALDPYVIVQKVSLASQDAQVDSKVVIFAVDNGNEAIFDFLGDVQNSREIHQSLVVFAQLTNASDEETFVCIT